MSARAAVFFAEFKRKNIDGTLLNSFNKITDRISWKNDDDITHAAEAIGATDIIIKIYEEHMDAYTAKQLSMKCKSSLHIIDREQFLELYHIMDNETQKFFQFLFMSPKLLFEHYSKKFAEGVVDHGFDIYVNEQMNNLDDECLYGPYSVIDCIINPIISSAIMTDIRSEISNSDMFWANLEMLINYGKTTGNGNIVSFGHALNIIQRLSSCWNQLLTSSHTMNETSNARVMHEADDDVDRIVNIYRGIYSDVPEDYPEANEIVTGLVSNFINFNKLTRHRKLQVSNYLLNNREKFNRSLVQSVKIVSDSIARDCDNCDSVDFEKYGVKNISAIGYDQKSDNLARDATMRIKDSFAKVRGKQSVQKMNYIVNCFIPLVNKFKSEVMNNYGDDAQRVLSSLNNSFQMFGGDIYDDEPEPVVLETPEPEVKYVRDNSFDDMYAELIYGGDPIIEVHKGPEFTPEQMIQEIVNAQVNFNKEYETCYRDLIKAIETIHFAHVYADSVNKLYPLCRVFNDIAIKKNKTTIYLSGLYGKKNRNSAYREVVQQTIKTLQDSKMNQFAECVRVLERLEKLLVESANKAKEIRNKFIKSPRASSALLIVAATQVKIPCKLTQADFNAFDEAINRLYYQIRNTSSESNILNSKDEIKKYLDKATNRAAIIKEQFELEDQQLQFVVQKIADVNLRNATLQMRRALNKTRMESVLYINNVVETYLTKQKMDDIHAAALSHDEIKHIEQAFLLFKRAKLSLRYKDEFKKLQKMIDENKSVFEIINQIARIFSASRYIEFIAMIYRELKIFDDNFNWDEFNRRMLQFIVMNSMDVSNLYKLPKATVKNLRLDTPEMIVQTRERFYSDIAAIIASELYHNQSNFNVIYDVLCFHSGLRSSTSTTMTKVQSVANIVLELKDQNLNICGDTAMTVATQADLDAFTLLRDIDGGKLKKFFDSVSFGKDSELAYNNSLGVVFNFSCDRNCKNSDMIIDAVFDSLVLGVVNLVDKYWQLKYHGSLPLPMNVNMMLKGGSVFDTEEFHDITTSKVIAEAVPFYITALNICQHYITQLAHKTDSDNIQQELKISSISVLYPIYEIFSKKYGATIDTLSMAQLTTCIGVLNDLWNQTTGSNEAKLSASIDLLLNELNASIFLTSDLENSIIESGFGSIASFNRLAYTDLDKVAATIDKIYKSAAMNAYVSYSPEEQQIGFERLMNRCYTRIKSIPEQQRMTELRAMLNAEDDTNIPMHEYYKFMDLVVAPMVVCYTSYNNVFRLFDIFATKANKVEGKMDLRDVRVKDKDMSMWEFMNKSGISNDDVRKYIIDSEAVQMWNAIQYGKIFENFIRTNKFIAPNFWLPTARNTWPTTPTAEYHINSVQGYTGALPSLRTIFGELNAKTVGDYFEYAIREFASDLDQVLHVFMSYPGMQDRVVTLIEDGLHDRIKAQDLLAREDIKMRLNILKTIKVEKEKQYVAPTWKSINIPVYADTDIVVPGINNVVFISVTGPLNIYKTNIYFPQTSELPFIITKKVGENAAVSYGVQGSTCRNGWTDYAIYRLAKCHPKYLIPYKLVQMLQSDPIIGKFCSSMYIERGRATSYEINEVGTYNEGKMYANFMTQNIITRSSAEKNKAITDYSTFGQTSVNSMVAQLPYIIYQIQNIYETTSSEVKVDEYTDIRVQDECASIISILSKFYNEISLSITPMNFLQEGVSTFNKDHCIGELKNFMNRSVNEINDFTGIEWANKYKFCNLTSITFPDFKNKDKFEWIHKFAENIFTHPTFARNFNIIVENMGKQTWNSILAKSSANDLSSIFGIDKELIDQINWLLDIFIQSGSSKMEELQYLFDYSSNSKKISKLETSNAIGDVGFRMQGGSVSKEFKEFTWAKINAPDDYIEERPISDLTKAMLREKKSIFKIKPGEYTGFIVRYTAKNQSETAPYVFAAYPDEATARDNLEVADNPPARLNAPYNTGEILGYGKLFIKQNDATAYIYRVVINGEAPKYNDNVTIFPISKNDRNQLAIVRALERGVDVGSQLMDGGKLPTYFTQAAYPFGKLYNDASDKNKGFAEFYNVVLDHNNIALAAKTESYNNADGSYKPNFNELFFGNIIDKINNVLATYKQTTGEHVVNEFIRNVLSFLTDIGLITVADVGDNTKTCTYNGVTIEKMRKGIPASGAHVINKDKWDEIYEDIMNFCLSMPDVPDVSNDDATNKEIMKLSKENADYKSLLGKLDFIRKDKVNIKLNSIDNSKQEHVIERLYLEALSSLLKEDVHITNYFFANQQPTQEFQNAVNSLAAKYGNDKIKDVLTFANVSDANQNIYNNKIDSTKLVKITNDWLDLTNTMKQKALNYFTDKLALMFSFINVNDITAIRNVMNVPANNDTFRTAFKQAFNSLYTTTYTAEITAALDALDCDKASSIITTFNTLIDEMKKAWNTIFDKGIRENENKIEDLLKSITDNTNYEICIDLWEYFTDLASVCQDMVTYWKDREIYDNLSDDNNYVNCISLPINIRDVDPNTKLGHDIYSKAMSSVVKAFLNYVNDKVYKKIGTDLTGPNDETSAIKVGDIDIIDFTTQTYMIANNKLVMDYDKDSSASQAAFLLLKNRFRLQYAQTNSYYNTYRKYVRTFEAIMFLIASQYDPTIGSENRLFYNYGKIGASISGEVDSFPGKALSFLFVTNPFFTPKYNAFNTPMIYRSAMDLNPAVSYIPSKPGNSSDTMRNGIVIVGVDDKDKATSPHTNKLGYPKNVYYFDIMELFEEIMQINVNRFIDVNVDEVQNYGFLLPPRIEGGDIEFDTILNDPSGNDAIKRMMALYDNKYVPYKIYATIFNQGFAFRCNSTPSIVNAAMVYFHKFNIGMSSIFDSLCFAQILLNRIILRNVISRIAAIAKEMKAVDGADRSTYVLVKSFLQNYVDKEKNIAWNIDTDFTKITNVKQHHDGRSKYFKQDEFIRDLASKTTFDEKKSFLQNVYTGPSVNNNFSCAFLAYVYNVKHPSLTAIPFTRAFKHLHRIGMQCTYINMLISLLKLTSFYDTEYETDVSFFGDQNNDPYNAI